MCSTDLSHSHGETLSPEIRVKEASPALDVSLLPARSATRGRRRSALFHQTLCSHHRNPDLKLSKSKGSRRVAFSLGGLPWPTALAVARLTGIHRSPQHGWSKLTPRSCRGTDKTAVVHTSTSKAGHVRELTKKQNDEGAHHTLTGTCTHDKISVEGDARPTRHCCVLTGPPLSWLVLQ